MPHRPSPARRRAASSGFSLVEVLVAMAIFMLVMLAAYQVYERSREGFQRGANQAELIQSVRVGFEQMVGDVRMAGFELDLDGDDTDYDNAPDEPIELMHEHAIIVRGNYDFADDAAIRGREPGLERNDDTACCPVVTTANDEIVGYALGKQEGTQPTGSVAARFDLTGTQATNDTSIRDASISDTGVISGEEAITINQLELTDDPPSPPYVLYRFTWDDAGNLVRQPLVDNIRSLRFLYYDEDGTELTPNGGADGNGGADRDLRWDVRRVKIELQGMEPEQDLRYVDYADTNAASRKRRKFLLEADVTPPNLGKRGVVDRSMTELDPVGNVSVCAGQCNGVRVSWEPSPAGSRVVDYVVSLYSGPGPTHAPNTLLYQDVIVPSFDTIPNPDEEWVSFTIENDIDLDPGTVVYAQVVARDSTGTESPPVESSDNPTAAKRFGTIEDTTRPEMPTNGRGSGYDNTNNNWPNARRNNASTGGAIQIVTDASSPYYPQANRITVGFQPPAYTANKGGAAGGGANNWTTQDQGGSVTASLTCHQAEISPQDATANLRTPIWELQESPSDSRPNVYVFRVSGSDPWNWDEDNAAGTGVTDPRNFVPSRRNLIAFVPLSMAGGTVTWEDTSSNTFLDYNGSPTQYDQRFESTSLRFSPAGMGGLGAPASVTPGEVYYYRFRVVDLCWNDRTDAPPALATAGPRDGLEDQWAADTQPLAAWSVKKDFTQAATWKARALRISPFYPPLRRQNGPNLTRPDQGTDDSDDYTTYASLDTYALPGYAIPALDAGGNWIPPEKPTEFYVAKANEAVNATIGNNGVRLVFNAARRNAPPPGETPSPVAYTRYELHRTAANSADPTLGELNFTPTDATRVATFRTNGRADSTNGVLPLLRYSLSSRDEGAPTAESTGWPQYLAQLVGKATEFANSPTNTHPYVYKLVTTQCTEFDDNIDTSSANRSEASPPFVFPCTFYDRVRSVTLDVQGGDTNTTSVTANVTMSRMNDSTQVDPTCDGVDTDADTVIDLEGFRSARLLAFQKGGVHDGDYVGTSNWKARSPSPNSCQVTFGSTDIATARRGWGSATTYVVELRDDDLTGIGLPGTTTVRGCRVRSDLLGADALAPGGGGGPSGPTLQPVSCTVNASDTCGTNGGQPRILGSIDNARVELYNNSQGMRVIVPVEGFTNVCTASDFTLMQAEFDLEDIVDGGSGVPAFVNGTITDGLTSGPMTLPTPDAGYPQSVGGDADRLRVRWFNAFTSGGGAYPVVDANNSGAGSLNLVFELNFAAPLCNVRLAAFNFRVPYTHAAGDIRELLCSERANDEANPESYATSPGLRGQGRGPEPTPTDDCVCDPACVTATGQGRCPFNDADNDGGMNSAADPNVTVQLVANDAGQANRRVRVNYTNSCSPCDLTVSYIEIDYIHCPNNNCGHTPTRNCNNGNPLPKRVAARWKQLGLPNITTPLPPPSQSNDNTACQVRNYRWQNLTGINARPNESIQLEIDFDSAMTGTHFRTLQLRFGDPMPNDSGGTDPTCSPSEPAPSTSRLPLRIPTP